MPGKNTPSLRAAAEARPWISGAGHRAGRPHGYPHERRAAAQPLLFLAALLLSAGLVANPATAQERGARPVTVERLGDLLVDRRFTAPASVVPANRSTIGAEVVAVIAEVPHDVGSRVAQGDLLVRLDDRDYRLAVRRAEAQLAAADARVRQTELRLERAKSLSGDGFISDDDLLARQTELDVAEAERAAADVALAEARLALERTSIRAPFAGTVVARSAQVGAHATPGVPLLTLVEDGDLEIEAEVDPAHAEFLVTSPEIELHVRDRTARLELLRLSRVIDPATRVQVARLGFAFDPSFPSGATGTLEWLGARGQLPAGLILRRGGDYGLFVAEGGAEDQRARFVVLPDAQEGRPVAVDLPDDTRIVTGGAGALQDGDRIQPTR